MIIAENKTIGCLLKITKHPYALFCSPVKSFLPPANEVCEGYVFTRVCQSFYSQGGVCVWSRGCLLLGGCLLWGCLVPGGACSRGGAWWRPPPTATAAGGTHPTGMYSCIKIFLQNEDSLCQNVNVV